jgi:hypothetical protein
MRSRTLLSGPVGRVPTTHQARWLIALAKQDSGALLASLCDESIDVHQSPKVTPAQRLIMVPILWPLASSESTQRRARHSIFLFRKSRILVDDAAAPYKTEEGLRTSTRATKRRYDDVPPVDSRSHRRKEIACNLPLRE